MGQATRDRCLGVDLLLGHLEVARELVVRSLRRRDDGPEVRGEDAVGLGEGDEGGLDEVAHGCNKEISVSVGKGSESEHALEVAPRDWV